MTVTTPGTDTVTPYFDWGNRYHDWQDDLIAAVRDVADSDEFILKSRVAQLEAAICDRTGAGHAIAVANGTGALSVILTALDIGGGDEVITPAFSFISTASTIILRGARPVFADVDEEKAALRPDTAAAAVSARTRAILPAYLFTTSPDMTALADLAVRHGVALIEDSAIALGATVDGVPAGRRGTAGVYSFFPGKPTGGAGDAGMIVTDDPQLARDMRMLRNHGQDLQTRFLHHTVGFNCRMDEITAGFLLRRLPRLDDFHATRRRYAQRYNDALAALAPDLRTPPGDFAGRAVYSYVVRAQRRDDLRAYLAERGIETVVYYPRPLHLQPAFADLGHQAGEFPVAEQLARESVALPLHPEMSEHDIDWVAAAVTSFYRGNR